MTERCAALLCALLLAACSNTEELRKAELGELATWLPGTYARDAADIAFVPVYAPFLSDHVFFAEESATDSHRQVLAQRIIAFDVIDRHIVQASYQLADPGRWRAGVQHPELFKSLMEQDLKVMAGCEMLWVKDGERFVGTNDRAHCRATRPGGGLAFLEARAELTADDYARAERWFDAAGRMIGGREDEALERFVKSGSH